MNKNEQLWSLNLQLTTKESQLLEDGLISLIQKGVDSETESIIENLIEKCYELN